MSPCISKHHCDRPRTETLCDAPIPSRNRLVAHAFRTFVLGAGHRVVFVVQPQRTPRSMSDHAFSCSTGVFVDRCCCGNALKTDVTTVALASDLLSLIPIPVRYMPKSPLFWITAWNRFRCPRPPWKRRTRRL